MKILIIGSAEATVPMRALVAGLRQKGTFVSAYFDGEFQNLKLNAASMYDALILGLSHESNDRNSTTYRKERAFLVEATARKVPVTIICDQQGNFSALNLSDFGKFVSAFVARNSEATQCAASMFPQATPIVATHLVDEAPRIANELILCLKQVHAQRSA
jgi:hypothetical protein